MRALFHSHLHLLSFSSSSKKKNLNCLWKVICVVHVSSLEMPVGRLLQSALTGDRSRLNLFPKTGQRELSINSESWGQLAYRWSGGGKLLSKLPARL